MFVTRPPSISMGNNWSGLTWTKPTELCVNMSFPKLPFVFFLLSIGWFNTSAQGDRFISGQVQDALTEMPVPYASIAIYAARDSSIVSGALADELGHFKVTGIGRGRYRCVITFIGYARWESSVLSFGPESPPELDLGTIQISPSVEAVDAVEIVAEQSTMEMLIDRRVFRVGSDLTSTGASAAELLTRVPSVSVDMDGNVSLRGSSNVQILIDGKPSGLSGPAGQAFLEQIPSQTIDRVEIITNPSARFDPDGMAGILNIVLKKNKLAGFNGQIQATPATSGNASSALSLNYRDEHWSVFSSVSLNRRDLFSSGSFDRTQLLNDSLQILHQERDGNDVDQSVAGRVGVDWTPQPGTQWSLNSNFRWSDEVEFETLSNHILWGASDLETARQVEQTGVDSGWDLDAGYRKTFGSNAEHVLEVSYRISQNQGDSRQELFEYSIEDPSVSLNDYNDQQSDNFRQVLALDYTRPLPENGRLEWGWKSNLSDQSATFGYLESDSLSYESGLYIPLGLTEVAYEFRYFEDVHAMYGTYGKDWGAWGVQLGSRLEQAFTRAELSEEGQTPFTNDYFSWYPSGSLSYEADARTTWSASYSRRVNRPRGRQVNPYMDDSDAFNIRFGNPKLRPEYTHSFEINRLWTKGRWSVATALFYKRTTDVIRHYSTINEFGVRSSTYANLASRHDEGLELILSAPLWKASSVRVTGELYHLANDAGDLEAATNAEGWTHNLSLFANLAMGKNWKAQINGRYRGASVTPQGQFNGLKTVDLAFQRSFLNRQLSVSLRISDVFDTRQWSYYTNITQPQFFQEVVRKRESRNAFLDLRWSFGKMEEGGKRSRGEGGESGGSFDGGEF